MIQLKVYENTARLTQYWLDLYDTEPIKLTLSIEDITSADATSTYSKAFKVPGTRKNNEFFKQAFEVNGILFDVTIKKPAVILVDGAEFRQGHIRLNKMIKNTELDRFDYELVFLGETRDFSSIIGDSPLCALNMTDITGGIGGIPLSKADIQYSWDAYPQTPSLTAGLHNGNIIYPLIDFGNTYNDAGNPIQPEVRTGAVVGGKPFTSPSHPLNLNQMKPMIRAKRIWDQIFDDAGYTYSSSFITSNRFHQMYVSAFGNDATPAYDAASSSEYNFSASEPSNSGDYQGFGIQIANQTEVDPSNSWTGSMYIAPATGTYTFTGSIYFYGYDEIISSWPPAFTQEYGVLCIHVNGNPTPVACGNPASQSTSSVTTTINLNTGDEITFQVNGNDNIDFVSCSAQSFACTQSPGNINPTSLLECTYKQIDFIKDILLMFRLVLSPDPNDPRNFIVEPWQTYINSGQLYDWSKKLVEEKDVVVEPVFFSQSDQITFTQPTDGDWINLYHQQSYKHNWGWLQFDSGNELLKGTRDVKINGIANTPMTQIEGDGTSSPWILPQIHTHTATDTATQHLPIKPKTRLLFYNGLKATTDAWHLVDNAPINNYPLVSQYETWPITPGSLNLAFSNDVQYWGTQVPGTYNLNGSTLYDTYWSRYVSSLYNKYSRRVTAYFVLNNIDLNTFSFDDTIFVNGVYYIPEKIIDLQIGAYTEVQVQLLTANDYVPTFSNETLFATITGQNNGCLGELGSVQVETGGAGPINWTLSNGLSGQFNNYSPPPYSFNIPNVPVGTWTITLTDAIGRTFTGPVTVPLGSSPTASYVVSPATPGLCDGGVTVTATGSGPFTIFWSDQYPLAGTFSRNNLCCGPHSFFVRDVNGCMSPSYLVQIECPPPVYIYEAHAYGKKCNTLSGTAVIVQSSVPLPINDGTVFGLDTISGCYAIIATSTLVPIANVVSTYPSCEACNEPTPIELHKDWYFFTQDTSGGLSGGYVPNANTQSALDKLLTASVRDYYMPLVPQPVPPQILDEVSTTQNLSTAFQYLLNSVGYVMPNAQRFIWPDQLNGFTWNDPNTASPQVKLDNRSTSNRYYVAVKNTIFNEFFEYNAVTEKWIGPKMWTAQGNAEFSGGNSGSYSATKSFTLGGVAYTLLLSESTTDLITPIYGTDPLCYLKFATTPAPTPTPTPTIVPLTYYYNIAPYDPITTCTPGQNVNPLVKSETLIPIGTTVKIGNIDPSALELINDYTCYKITYMDTYGYAQADVVSIYDTCEQCQGSITPTECTAYTIYNGSQSDEPYSYTACDGTPVQSFIGGFNYDGPFCAQTDSISSGPNVFITDEFACGSPVVCSAYTIFNGTKSSKFYSYFDCEGNSIESSLAGQTSFGPFCAQVDSLLLGPGVVIQDETACEPALYHYEVEECNTLEVKIIQSQYLLNAGDVYSITGFSGCWKVTIQSIASGVFPAPEVAWISCGACNGLPSGTFLTDKKQRNGSPVSVCAIDHPLPIYNFDVTNPVELQIGMTMWADAGMVSTWDGQSLWYSIADESAPNTPRVSVLIDSIGVIRELDFCGAATCFSYTQGGYNIGSCTYLDCEGNMSGADYNGPSASGFDATTFCATQIIEWSGNEPVQNGSIC